MIVSFWMYDNEYDDHHYNDYNVHIVFPVAMLHFMLYLLLIKMLININITNGRLLFQHDLSHVLI